MKKPSSRYNDLIGLYTRMHEEGNPEVGIEASQMFPGTALLPHVRTIAGYLKKHQCKSVLDYGCGKATAYKMNNFKLKDGTEISSVREYWNVDEICFYDPAVSEYSNLTDKKCDAVICTDVLEHCPEQDVGWILQQIFSRANKFVYANIASYPAVKKLPNGENAHATIRSPEWWKGMIEVAASNTTVAYHFVVEERRPRGVIGPIKLPFTKGIRKVYTTIDRNIRAA